MKKHYLDWGRAPVVVYITNDGLPRAAFLKNDPFGAWKPCNPLQVWEEGTPLSRRDWNIRFKGLVEGDLPKLKQWNPDEIYVDEDPWYPPDYIPPGDEEVITKAEEETELRPIKERMEWDAEEIEVDPQGANL